MGKSMILQDEMQQRTTVSCTKVPIQGVPCVLESKWQWYSNELVKICEIAGFVSKWGTAPTRQFQEKCAVPSGVEKLASLTP